MSPAKPPEKPVKTDVHAERAIEAMRRATEDVKKGMPDALAGRFRPTPKKAAE